MVTYEQLVEFLQQRLNAVDCEEFQQLLDVFLDNIGAENYNDGYNDGYQDGCVE